ncbi:TPA: hypothetical protein QCZ17_003009 [Bacillus cereus]|nr:hypothetical protein [Bacillus cereus]
MLNGIKFPIVTLGPMGTDASVIASSLSNEVIFKESFEQSMEYAHTHKLAALICCGFVERKNGQIQDGWVDLNFRYMDKMKLTHAFHAKTKMMCVAKRKDCEEPKTIIIHPATQTFANIYTPGLEVHYTNNKPSAVRLTAKGLYDMCIGSVDVIGQYECLEILSTFQPSMVWAIYIHKNQELEEVNEPVIKSRNHLYELSPIG